MMNWPEFRPHLSAPKSVIFNYKNSEENFFLFYTRKKVCPAWVEAKFSHLLANYEL